MLRLAGARLLAAAPRGYATAAVAPAKLDWQELAGRVNSDEAKREVASLKKALDDMKEQLSAQAKEPEAIDFAFYRKSLSAPGVVDAFEKAYSGLKVPAYEGKEAEALRAKFAELEAAAAAAEARSKTRISELEKELVALAAEKEKLKTLTVDDVLTAEPALREKLNADIRADKWY